MTPSDVLKYAEKHGAKLVDLKFIDLPGIWQHTTVTIEQLKEEFQFTSSYVMPYRMSCRPMRLLNLSWY